MSHEFGHCLTIGHVGDGALTPDVLFEDGGDLLLANDQIGEGNSPFQVQHPNDHFYASVSGSPMDCPQPDVGLTPGERTDWDPSDDDGAEDGRHN